MEIWISLRSANNVILGQPDGQTSSPNAWAYDPIQFKKWPVRT